MIKQKPVLVVICVPDIDDNNVTFFCRVNAKYASKGSKKHKYLKKCHYHEETDPYCPNFRLGYIANQARENFSELCRTVSILRLTHHDWDQLLI